MNIPPARGMHARAMSQNKSLPDTVLLSVIRRIERESDKGLLFATLAMVLPESVVIALEDEGYHVTTGYGATTDALDGWTTITW